MSSDTEVNIWRVVTTITAGGVLAVLRWMLGIASKQRELDAWRTNVDNQLEKGETKISATHDAVLILKTNVENLTGDVGEIKDGQKDILGKLTDLVSRVPTHKGREGG